MRALLLLVNLVISLLAIDTGELSFYLLKDGKPMANQEVVIFKKGMQQTANIEGYATKQAEFKTDSDGYIYSVLPTGSFQIQVIAIENGVAQAYIKKNFIIKKGKESQLIVSLNRDDTLAFEDLEAPKVESVDTNITQQKHVEIGTIFVILNSSEDQKPINGARIFVRGQSMDIKTDAKGFATLTLPEGEQTLSIIHSDFSSQTLKVKVIAKERITKSIDMTPAAMELEEFVVLAPHVEGSVASVIAQERNSDAVGNVLGSEQFSKSGDSDAAGALKRVSGITIVGGKYVYVRGLGDRYSTVMLNNMHLPSPEPTKRVVPLDIFPTSVIKDISIQKSYTADLPGSFGGGTVLIRSTDIPENEGFVNASATLYVNDTTGKQGTISGDNTLPLPANVINASNDFQIINGFNKELTKEVLSYRSLNHQNTTIKPGMKFEISAGQSFEVSDNFILGASGTVFYKNKSDVNTAQFHKYIYNPNTNNTELDSDVDADVTTMNTQLGGMFNLGAHYLGDNIIKYTFFTTNEYKDQTTLTQTQYVGTSEDKDKTYYEYSEKNVLTHQVSGENRLYFGSTTNGYFDDLIIKWGLENAQATRYEPGTVEYDYLHQTSGLNWSQDTTYFYNDLEDTVQNYRVDFSLPFEFNGNENYTKAGLFIYNKSRTFDERKFFMHDDAASSTGIDLAQELDAIYTDASQGNLKFKSNDADDGSYEANQNVTAFYIKQLLSVTSNFDILVSLRQESSTQQLIRSKTGEPYTPLETSDIFPGLGLTYRLNRDMQFRAAYASTISRPDFREFSPNRYQDPITGNTVFGNPNLQATYINHIDFKYEWYFASDELFSVGLFAKEFTDPIEAVVQIDPVDGNQLLQTYRNAESAQSYGAEIDYRKRFGFIDSRLDNVLFATNVAVIQSTVVLQDNPNDIYVSGLTSKERPMQGQSPYVMNFTLGYDDPDTGDSALFLFNQIGERIVSLGTNNNKDMYQEAFAKLDFVTRWKLNNYYLKDSDFTYSIKFKAENILDSEQHFAQGEHDVFITKPGREFSLSLKIAY